MNNQKFVRSYQDFLKKNFNLERAIALNILELHSNKLDLDDMPLIEKMMRESKGSALLSQLLFFRSGQGGDRELFFDMAKSQFDEAWIDEVYKDKLQRSRARFFIRKANLKCPVSPSERALVNFPKI